MLDIINEALKNQNYYICLYKNNIYIYNFEEVLNFDDDIINLKIKGGKIIKIKGSNLHIKKLEHSELLIEGNIYGVTYE